MLSLSSLKINLYNALMSGASGYALSLDLLSGTLDNRVTFSRGTNATLVDATGKITYAPNNLLLRSEEFDNAVWTKTNSTVTANTTVAPNGTTTADTITDDATSGQHQVTQSISVNIGSRYTLTTYVKAGTARYARMALGGTLTFTAATFDLQLGIVQTGSATITAVGNNWFRISISSTASSSGSGSSAVGITNATGTLYSGTGGTLFLWGAQLEQVTYQTTAGPYVATTTSAYYGPRFDYDPVTLAAKGLMVEEQRTNLILQSQTFDNASWAKNSLTVTANAAVAPDGTTTADKIIKAAVTTQANILQGLSTVVGAQTISFFAKAAEYDTVSFSLYNATDTHVARGQVNLSTGAVIATQNGVITTQSFGNGWWRITATGTTTVSAGNTLYIYPKDVTTYLGNGVDGIFIWGAQLEAGAFATSYIPTVASTVTRSADQASMTGTNFSSWYNQSEGTLVSEFSSFSPTSASNAAWTISDETNSNRWFAFAVSSTIRHFMATGGVTQASIDVGTYAANTVFKSAMAISANSVQAAVNGTLGTEDTTATVPTVVRLTVGSSPIATTNFLNGHIRQIAYYNTRLSDAQLQTLTQPDATLSLNFISSIYEV